MRKTLAVAILAALAFGLAGTPASAFNQPPLNLGLTDILDGALPGPGTYFTEYIQGYESGEFKNANGADLGNLGNVLSMNQFVHVYKHQMLGGNLGVDVLLPLVGISGGDTISTNPGYLGDLTVGPFLQWFDTKLMGRPFFQRVELDITLPTGQYDSKYLANPGSNHWVIEPYYAFTWFITPQFSTSWRLHYTYSTANDDPYDGFKAAGVTDIQPGQAFHFNYSFEYEFFKNFRGAIAGYYLKQLSSDDCSGTVPPGVAAVCGPKEEVFAIGPAAHWIVSPNFSMGLKMAWETSAENRPEGTRTTFRMTYKF